MWDKIAKLEASLTHDQLEGDDRIGVLNKLSWWLRGLDEDRAHAYALEAYDLAQALGLPVGMAYGQVHTAFIKLVGGKGTSELVASIQDALCTFETHREIRGQGFCHCILSMVHWRTGDREKAFSSLMAGLGLLRNSDYRDEWAWAEALMGGFYLDLEDYHQALPHIQVAERMFEEMEDVVGLTNCVTNRGVIHRMLGDYEQALLCHERGKDLAVGVGQMAMLARSQREMGQVYESMCYLTEAYQYYKDSLAMREEIKNIPGMITSQTDLGRVLAKQGEFDRAEQFLFMARKNAERIGVKPKLVDIFYEQAQLYKLAQEPMLALENYEAYMELKSEVEGEQSVLQIRNLQSMYEAEKSRHETEIGRLRNVELRTLIEKVEKQQEDIMASIRYARGIQDAILPSLSSIEKQLPDGMVFYHPRDVVSGDFYWYAEVDGVQIVAAVDCTGHGVPGAFMVVLSNGLLEDIVVRDKVLSPEDILHELDDRLINVLQRRNADSTSYDGLDIALVARDTKAGRLRFAGAKRPMLVVREGQQYRIRGSRASIGGWVGEDALEKDFREVEWITQPGDRIFLYSDGFQDQFGGPYSKKYGGRRFRELLAHSPASAEDTKAMLLEEMRRWQGEESQTDDLLVVSWQEP